MADFSFCHIFAFFHPRAPPGQKGACSPRNIDDFGRVAQKNKNIINIGVASWLPLHRSIKLLDKKDRKKINIVGQDFQKADYIYSNFISEVDKNINDKYKIPSNFTTRIKFILDEITVYEVFKKNKL